MAAESEPIIRVHVDIRALEPAQQSRVQVNEADHVEAVVLERGFEKISRAGAQVIEVSIRHKRARQRVVALITEHALLDVAQRAGLEAMSVQGADKRQQVYVRFVGELARHASHHPTGAQHG